MNKPPSRPKVFRKKKNRDPLVTAAIIALVGTIIYAVATVVGPLLVASIQKTSDLTRQAAMTLTPTVSSISGSSTAASASSAPTLSLQTPPSTEAYSGTLTTPSTPTSPAPTSTQVPEIAPTKIPPCDTNGECYTDFNTLDTRVWCGPLQPYELSNDQLVIKADGGSEYEFKPCLGDEPLKFVELILRVDPQRSVAHKYSYAGLETGPDFSFKLNSLGGGFVNKGWDNLDEQVFSATIGSTHTLRIEWTDNRMRFFVDGPKLQYESDSVGSNWFSLVVKADSGRDITAIFDSVRWGYLSP
jgi:hypothetical protein